MKPTFYSVRCMIRVALVASGILVTTGIGSLDAEALPITGLWNTGVDDLGNPVAAGGLETHYGAELPGDANPDYRIRTVLLPSSYVRNPSDAAWIGPSLTASEGALVDDPVGSYVYRLTFDLSGYATGTAAIWGLWASDNHSSIRLNGVDTGWAVGFEQFGRLTAFSLFDGMLGLNGVPLRFEEALNTLEFHVINGSGWGNPSALLVSGLGGSAEAVPDQGSILLLLIGAFICLVPVSRALRS
ncbi:MAG: hypothetical protein JNK85_26095 [Verrucomicrobiales bacterium]|nr:hypothetical protein [Verrucomicrobiales bacterium]